MSAPTLDIAEIDPTQTETPPEGTGDLLDGDLSALRDEIAESKRAAAPTRPRSSAKLRLRKLIVHGFKSFADKVEFAFDRPIVGVVGPNGCGKSNVVDAVRWVLGEQSAKSLRGGAMLDVIFNGTSTRPPGGFAEVTLIFDNPADDEGNRPLSSPSDEVAVGRLLLRDGTSTYKLNGRNARLRDVKELFLDTGVGVDAYSVIEQGRIAQLLDAGGQERRAVFEEAAGISRFRHQRREATRRLERVEQNLLRLGDVLEEVERRLRGVRSAAGKARTYQELSARLGELRLASLLHDYHALHTRRAALVKKRDDAAFERDDAAEELRRARESLAERRREAEASGEAKRQADAALSQARNKAEQSRQRGEYARREARQVEAGGEDLRRERAEAGRLSDENAAALAADQAASERADVEAEKARSEVERLQSESREAGLRRASLSRAQDAARAAVQRVTSQLASAERRSQAVAIEQSSAADRRGRLDERRREVAASLKDVTADADGQRREVDALTARAAAGREELAGKRRVAAELNQAHAKTGEDLSAAREARSAAEGRRRLLADLEAKREGVGAGVRCVLERRDTHFPFVRGLVADLLRVDAEHATTIEAALDGRDAWLICDGDDAAIRAAEPALADLPERVSLLRLSAATPSPADLYALISAAGEMPLRLARDLVVSEPQDRPTVDALLGHTAVVASLADALRLQEDGPAGLRFVTHAGEVVEADGTIKAGPLGPAMGLLSRRSELAAATLTVEQTERTVAQLQAKLDEGGARSRATQAEADALRERVYELDAARVEAAGRLAATEDKAAALARELPAIDKDSTSLAADLDRLSAEAATLETSAETLRGEQQKHADEADRIAGELDGLAADLATSAEAITAARVLAGQAGERRSSARRDLERHAARAGELQRQIARLDASLAGLQGQLRDANEAAENADAEARRQDALAKEQVGRVDMLAKSLAAARNAAADLARAADAAESRHDAADATARDAESALSELAVRLETLTNRATEEADLDLPATYAERASAEGGFAEQAGVDWSAVADEVRDLRGRLSRLGGVNLDAIAEQEHLEARRETLAEQTKDLSDAKSQLADLIRTIDTESGRRFTETFEAVRGQFNALFRKLFGGGRADVFLQTEVEERQRDADGNVRLVTRKVDALEAGVEIVARPPGKQPVSIAQLSGGEKTMTCVALLMSIFRSRPSPFCILDEVDAALDEANNVRFNRILDEFLGESQFIVVTHSKRTMQAADVLYGVTMQEPGVSKKVAVRFEQVDQGGRVRMGEAAT